MDNHSALLVMDIQDPILNGIANKEDYLQKLQQTIAAARSKNVLVIYSIVGFRPNAPEFNSRSKGLRFMKEKGIVDALVDPTLLVPVTDEDLVVTKRRVSTLTGSDLEIILRAKNIDHLVLTGVSTSGTVLATLYAAYDKDYALTVLSDLCVDHDEEVQRVLTEKVFPRRADVLTSMEWLGTLHSA